MQGSAILYSNDEILLCIDSIMGDRSAVQSMFNQGKIVFQTGILARDDQFLYFDFDGIDETSLISAIDFYSSIIFVFYEGEYRYQFLAKSGLLTSLDGETVLKVALPSSINRVPSRKSNRFILPDGFASITFQTMDGQVNLPVREISTGGLSIWSNRSYSLSAHSIVKNATLLFHDGFTLVCSFEVSRVNYIADGPDGMTHIISTQFLHLNEKQQNLLIRQLNNYHLASVEQ